MQKKIRVTQGHESGIGLEIFIKSFICLSKSNQKSFILYTTKKSLTKVLNIIHIDYQYFSKLISINYFEPSVLSETLTAINKAIEDINSNDILLTLPSSKEQFQDGNVHYSGHTEYFRKKFKNNNIVMSFISNDLNVLLLTDHIPLVDVPKNITLESIRSKVLIFLKNIKNIRNITNILFSGINPHSGENGLIGYEDRVIELGIKNLKKELPEIRLSGPYAGDTLFFQGNTSADLFIYSSHDQGLNVFKQYNGLQGINLTLGLPFIRVSPDHGTAFELYGKNEANYLGMNYLLGEILKWR